MFLFWPSELRGRRGGGGGGLGGAPDSENVKAMTTKLRSNFAISIMLSLRAAN